MVYIMNFLSVIYTRFVVIGVSKNIFFLNIHRNSFFLMNTGLNNQNGVYSELSLHDIHLHCCNGCILNPDKENLTRISG